MSSFRDAFEKEDTNNLQYDNIAFLHFLITFAAGGLCILAWITLSNLFSGENRKYKRIQNDPLFKDKVANQIKRNSKNNSLLGSVLRLLLAIILIYTIYSCHQTIISQPVSLKGFDPYELLGVEYNTPVRQIKKAYRKLALDFHPDRNPNDPQKATRFVMISKAYECLTDEKAKENCKKFGNPEGHSSFNVGIALPSFLVDPNYQIYVMVTIFVLLLIVFPRMFINWNNKNQSVDQRGVIVADYPILFKSMQLPLDPNTIRLLSCAMKAGEDPTVKKQLVESKNFFRWGDQMLKGQKIEVKVQSGGHEHGPGCNHDHEGHNHGQQQQENQEQWQDQQEQQEHQGLQQEEHLHEEQHSHEQHAHEHSQACNHEHEEHKHEHQHQPQPHQHSANCQHGEQREKGLIKSTTFKNYQDLEAYINEHKTQGLILQKMPEILSSIFYFSLDYSTKVRQNSKPLQRLMPFMNTYQTDLALFYSKTFFQCRSNPTLNGVQTLSLSPELIASLAPKYLLIDLVKNPKARQSFLKEVPEQYRSTVESQLKILPNLDLAIQALLEEKPIQQVTERDTIMLRCKINKLNANHNWAYLKHYPFLVKEKYYLLIVLNNELLYVEQFQFEENQGQYVVEYNHRRRVDGQTVPPYFIKVVSQCYLGLDVLRSLTLRCVAYSGDQDIVFEKDDKYLQKQPKGAIEKMFSMDAYLDPEDLELSDTEADEENEPKSNAMRRQPQPHHCADC